MNPLPDLAVLSPQSWEFLMVIVVVWNTYSPKEEPVMAAGYNEQNAWWNHPLEDVVRNDEHSQYHVGIIRPERCEKP